MAVFDLLAIRAHVVVVGDGGDADAPYVAVAAVVA